jgi:hypothetical protein
MNGTCLDVGAHLALGITSPQCYRLVPARVPSALCPHLAHGASENEKKGKNSRPADMRNMQRAVDEELPRSKEHSKTRSEQ